MSCTYWGHVTHTSQLWVVPVTHMSEPASQLAARDMSGSCHSHGNDTTSCQTHDGVMSHMIILMRMTRPNHDIESCHSHSCHTHDGVTSHVFVSYGIHMSESHHTHE